MQNCRTFINWILDWIFLILIVSPQRFSKYVEILEVYRIKKNQVRINIFEVWKWFESEMTIQLGSWDKVTQYSQYEIKLVLVNGPLTIWRSDDSSFF